MESISPGTKASTFKSLPEEGHYSISIAGSLNSTAMYISYLKMTTKALNQAD